MATSSIASESNAAIEAVLVDRSNVGPGHRVDLLDRPAFGSAARFHLDLQYLGASHQQVHGSHVLPHHGAQDRLGGHQPRREGSVDSERVHERDELLTRNDRHTEVGPDLLGVQGRQQVGTVVARAGHESARPVDPVGDQGVLADALLVQHRRGPEPLRDVARALGIALHHRDTDAADGLEVPRQWQADPARPEDHDVTDVRGATRNIGDRGSHFVARGGNENVVTFLRSIARLGREGAAVADDPEDGMRPHHAPFAQRAPDQRRPVREDRLRHRDASVGKVLHVHGARQQHRLRQILAVARSGWMTKSMPSTSRENDSSPPK